MMVLEMQKMSTTIPRVSIFSASDIRLARMSRDLNRLAYFMPFTISNRLMIPFKNVWIFNSNSSAIYSLSAFDFGLSSSYIPSRFEVEGFSLSDERSL